MPMRALRSLLAAILILLPSVSVAAEDGAADAIRIGGGFALTGAESTLDIAAHEGATLAVEEINAAEGSMAGCWN